MEAVKLAIIGGGNIGMRHLDLGLADRGCDIVGVVDPSAAAAQREWSSASQCRVASTGQSSGGGPQAAYLAGGHLVAVAAPMVRL